MVSKQETLRAEQKQIMNFEKMKRIQPCLKKNIKKGLPSLEALS